MINNYYPHQSFINYFKKHGGQISFSDDDLIKLVEVFYVLNTMNPETSPSTKNCSSKVIEERKAICYNCPFYDQKVDSCKLCGCVIEHKTTHPLELCPQRFWGIDTEFVKYMFVLLANEMSQFLRDNPDTLSIEQYNYQRTFKPLSIETNETR